MIFIGYISATHGLKGDLVIKSKFDKINNALKVNNKIYINNVEHTITNVKEYKNNYLIKIDNLKNINLVEQYIATDVYIKREELNLNGDYLLEDLIGLKIECNEKDYGIVKEVLNNGKYNILSIDYTKTYMIPMVDEYIIKVDLDNKKIICKNIEGLII